MINPLNIVTVAAIVMALHSIYYTSRGKVTFTNALGVKHSTLAGRPLKVFAILLNFGNLLTLIATLFVVGSEQEHLFGLIMLVAIAFYVSATVVLMRYGQKIRESDRS